MTGKISDNYWDDQIKEFHDANQAYVASPFNIATSLSAQADQEAENNNLERAMDLYKQAEVAWHNIDGAFFKETDAMNKRANLNRQLGRFQEEIDITLAIIVILKLHPEAKRLLGMMLAGLGLLYKIQKQWQKALVAYDEANEVCSDGKVLVAIRLQKAFIFDELEQFENALHQFEQAEGIQRQIHGHGELLADILVQRVEMLIKLQRPVQALAEEALSIYQALPETPAIARHKAHLVHIMVRCLLSGD